MTVADDPCVLAYRDLKNLKLVGERLGVPWQTVYVRLKRAGEPVTGDKSRYGSDTDKLAARAESWFNAIIPDAINNNLLGFQSKVDFNIGKITVDVKVCRPRISVTSIHQWSWSVKKQELIADHFVCIALEDRSDNPRVSAVLLIPGELARNYTTINLSRYGNSLRGKWSKYSVYPTEMREFFKELPNQ